MQMTCFCIGGPNCCLNRRYDYNYWQSPEIPYHEHEEPIKIKKKRRKNIRGKYVETILPHRLV
jgi:hypothetical protein